MNSMLYVTSVFENGDDTFFSYGFAFECKLSELNCTSFFFLLEYGHNYTVLDLDIYVYSATDQFCSIRFITEVASSKCYCTKVVVEKEQSSVYIAVCVVSHLSLFRIKWL